MWRTPGSVFNSFCTATRYHFVPLPRHISTKRPLQWQEVRLIKHLSSESSSRSQNGRDEVQTLFLSQGKEAIKITRLGMYVDVAMAATKVQCKYIDIIEIIVIVLTY